LSVEIFGKAEPKEEGAFNKGEQMQKTSFIQGELHTKWFDLFEVF